MEQSFFSKLLDIVTAPFNILRNGNLEGKVQRVFAAEPVPVYDSPVPGSPVLLRLQPGELIVAFDDPGTMRQINTAAQAFGYIGRNVELLPVSRITPEELYEPAQRSAFLSGLPDLTEHALAYEAEQRRLKLIQRACFGGFILLVVVGILWVLFRPADVTTLAGK